MLHETYQNGVLISTEEYDNPDLIKKRAQYFLDKSDLTAIRCVKAGIPFPSEWQAYVAVLRSIVTNGVDNLPTQPAYPEGT